jgi:hypothetical protein
MKELKKIGILVGTALAIATIIVFTFRNPNNTFLQILFVGLLVAFVLAPYFFLTINIRIALILISFGTTNGLIPKILLENIETEKGSIGKILIDNNGLIAIVAFFLAGLCIYLDHQSSEGKKRRVGQKTSVEERRRQSHDSQVFNRLKLDQDFIKDTIIWNLETLGQIAPAVYLEIKDAYDQCCRPENKFSNKELDREYNKTVDLLRKIYDFLKRNGGWKLDKLPYQAHEELKLNTGEKEKLLEIARDLKLQYIKFRKLISEKLFK